MTTATETVKIEENGPVTWLRINRPEAMNALNAQVMSDLEKALDNLPTSTRCMVVVGAGKAFVAGADIKEMQNYTSEEAHQMAKRGQVIFNKIETHPVPSIACVNGFALGGGMELALSCDFIVASEKAKLGLPEVSLGLIPGYGGTQRLARHAGKAIARRVTFTGQPIPAQQFFDWGVVTQLFAPDDLEKETQGIAEMISTRSPQALKLAKKAINEGFDMTQDEGMILEASLFGEVFSSKDSSEGITAFLEKRMPHFTGE